MKKSLQLFIALLLLSMATQLNAQRYLSEIFTDVTVTTNVVYGQNLQFLTGQDTVSLKADIYQPVGDAAPTRATVIMIHTGSFLPIFYNGQATGTKTDSAIVNMCKQFARRGFTAISMDYRLGWNPTAIGAPGQEIRTGTLLQAAGRGIQDAKACVRYFRNEALNANTYHIDENNIILGGMGTGGYIALGYATCQGNADVSLPKFLASTNNPSYGFTAGVSYFDSTLWGNIDGYGGMLNISTNTPGVSNAIAFVFNLGGALADSSWLRAGDVPMVCFHPANDPFAPYADGPVIVPTTGDFVVDVSGSYSVIKKADTLLNNSAFQFNTWSDPYTLTANLHNNGYDGLYPFILPNPGPPFYGQAGPWEFWDSTTVYYICMNLLGFTQGHVDTILTSGLFTNPDMSKTKSLAYIDTIMGYLCPRMFQVISTGTNENAAIAKNLKVYPNPAADILTIEVTDQNMPVRSIHLYDVAGREIYTDLNVDKSKVVLNIEKMKSGVYFLRTGFDTGESYRKVIKQ